MPKNGNDSQISRLPAATRGVRKLPYTSQSDEAALPYWDPSPIAHLTGYPTDANLHLLHLMKVASKIIWLAMHPENNPRLVLFYKT